LRGWLNAAFTIALIGLCWGLIFVVGYLAVELAPRGIAVNAVSGGMIDSDTMRGFPQYEILRDTIVQRTPAMRLGTPEELADVVQFLCTERARWIFGQTLIADGGFSLV